MKNKIDQVYAELKSSLKLGSSTVDSLIMELANLKVALSNLDHRLKYVEAQQKMRDVLLPDLKSIYQGRREINISCDSPLTAAQGFYEIEYSDAGKSYRWTGPKPSFHFDLHLDRTIPIRFFLHLQKPNTMTSNGIKCFSDGAEVPMLNSGDHHVDEFYAVLMPRPFLGVTRLEFCIAEMSRPSENSDSRSLGTVFLDLKLDEASEKFVGDYFGRVEYL